MPAMAATQWDLWRDYAGKFVQEDGRTVDFAAGGKTTSEGQSYSLFFALVADDRQRFERVLDWTQNNLAAGDLASRLPAWSWGEKADKSWGVQDANPASDADMWIAYALIEAGRLWGEPRYSALGEVLLARIEKEEVVDLPGFGFMLLPGAKGFATGKGRYRFNPSYLPVQLLRRFAKIDADGPWGKIAENSVQLIAAASPAGFCPDWVSWQAGRGFESDAETHGIGSYDAIRVYLWAGMLNESDSLYRPLYNALGAMKEEVRNNLIPPAKVNSLTGKSEGTSPPGFSAALLPYLRAEKKLLELQKKRLMAATFAGLLGKNPNYYDQVLALFGEGWTAGRFSFDVEGRLQPAWENNASR